MYGEHDPEVGLPGATASADPELPGRHAGRASSTIGRLVAGQRGRASAALDPATPGARRRGSRTMTANGLSPRRLRRRSSATASRLVGVAGEVVAAEALDRDDRARRAAVATRPRRARRVTVAGVAGARGRTSASRGPQSGQQIGWAWKRRSAGSAYSAAQSAHIGKPAIVVVGRS